MLRFEKHKKKLEDIYTKVDKRAANELGINSNIPMLVKRRTNNLISTHKFTEKGIYSLIQRK